MSSRVYQISFSNSDGEGREAEVIVEESDEEVVEAPAPGPAGPRPGITVELGYPMPPDFSAALGPRWNAIKS
jgi:hypothetical protein